MSNIKYQMFPLKSIIYGTKPFPVYEKLDSKELAVIKHDKDKGVDKVILINTQNIVTSSGYVLHLKNGIKITTTNLKIMLEVSNFTIFEDYLNSQSSSEKYSEYSYESLEYFTTFNSNHKYVNKLTEIKDLKSGDFIVLSNGWVQSFIMNGETDKIVQEFKHIVDKFDKYNLILFDTYEKANKYAKKLLLLRFGILLFPFGTMWAIKLKHRGVIRSIKIENIEKIGDIPCVRINTKDFSKQFVCCDIFFTEIT